MRLHLIFYQLSTVYYLGFIFFATLNCDSFLPLEIRRIGLVSNEPFVVVM